MSSAVNSTSVCLRCDAYDTYADVSGLLTCKNCTRGLFGVGVMPSDLALLLLDAVPMDINSSSRTLDETYSDTSQYAYITGTGFEEGAVSLTELCIETDYPLPACLGSMEICGSVNVAFGVGSASVPSPCSTEVSLTFACEKMCMCVWIPVFVLGAVVFCPLNNCDSLGLVNTALGIFFILNCR